MALPDSIARILPCLLACWVLLSCMTTVHAGTMQPLADIRAAAITALGATGGTAEAVLGANVRMPLCSQPLQGVATGPHTAQVRCADAPGWKLYVPVRVRREADVVVLRGPVRAGTPITADQLVVQRRDIAHATAPAITDPAQIIGQTLAKPLAAGSTLTTADVAQGPPMRRGDPVVLLTRIGSVEVRMAGRALGPAGAGGIVSAENVESRRIVRGRITAPGVVEVSR